MQGRPDQGNESWDRERATAARLAALKGTRATLQGTGKYRAISSTTGKHGAIPQRPPNMPPYMDSRPATLPRAPRPQHQTQQPRNMRRLIIVLASIVAIIVIISFAIAFVAIGAINQNTGPAMTAVNFLNSVSNNNYKDAYQYLGPGVTIRINPDEFTQKAGNLDNKYGTITNYSENANSATMQNNIQGFTYTITRSKSSKTYTLTLLLQQDPNDSNTWKIVDYGTSCDGIRCNGTTLGPTQS